MAHGGLSFMEQCLDALEGSGDADQLADSQLLERYAHQRHESAFAALVQRHGPLVLGVCQRVLQNRADAEDAFQATFFVLARKAATLGSCRSLSSWLYTVAYRAAVKAKILAARRRAHENQVSAMSTPTPEHDPAWRELRPILDEELNRLPEKYRVPLVLCYLEGKTNDQAAAVLGWPSGSMSRRLSRGRQLLRERLTRRGVTLSLAVVFALLPKQALAAGVPEALANLTVRGAIAFGSKSAAAASAAKIAAAAGHGSPQAIALAEVVLKSMGISPFIKVAAGVLLTLGLLGLVGTSTGVFHPAPPEAQATFIVSGGFHCKPPQWLVPSLPWQLQCSLDARSTGYLAIALDPDGRLLATATEHPQGTVYLWDLLTNKEKARLGGMGGPVRALAFSPDGLTLAAGSQAHTITLWDVASATVRCTLGGHGGKVDTVAFSPDGKTLASGSSDTTIRLWDVASGQEQTALTDHSWAVRNVVFSADGQTLASASLDGTVRLWDLSRRVTRVLLSAHEGGANAVAFSGDGLTLATGGADGTVKLWDTASGRAQKTLQGNSSAVRSVLFAPDGGLLLAASLDQTVWAWVTKDSEPKGKALPLAKASGHLLSCARAVPKLAIGGTIHKVTVWKAREVAKDQG